MKRSLIDNARRNARRKVSQTQANIAVISAVIIVISVLMFSCLSGVEKSQDKPDKCGVETFDALHISEKYQCAYNRDFRKNEFGKVVNYKAILSVYHEMMMNRIEYSDDVNLVDETTKIAIDDKTYTLRVLYRTYKESTPRYSDVVIDLKTGDTVSVDLNPKLAK